MLDHRLLSLLVCPECQSSLDSNDEALTCQGCKRVYPVTNGIPRMLPAWCDGTQQEVVDGFARQWKKYDEWRPLYVKQFLGWIAPVTGDLFRGKLVLDAGCGKGRHLRAASDFGADLVVGVDLGTAVDVAWEALRDRPNVAIVQADLFKLPFRPGTFDYAYSVGVLHHTPDPAAAFRSVLSRVRPGGHISAWVYGKENNGWLEHVVAPVRNFITSKIPETALTGVAVVLSWVLLAVTRGLYRGWHALFPGLRLVYQDYMLTLSEYPRREIESIVFDHLHPVLNAYIPREEVARWLEGLGETSLRWHNRNSWAAFGRVPD